MDPIAVIMQECIEDQDSSLPSCSSSSAMPTPATRSTPGSAQNSPGSAEISPGSTTSARIPLKRCTYWTSEMSVLLCREVEFVNPFQYKQRSGARADAWEEISNRLKSYGHDVSKRAVRDRYKAISDGVKRKNAKELRESGIAPELTESEAEMTQIVEELLEVEQDTKEQPDEEEKKKQDGVEVRKRALETFTETQKRVKSEEGTKEGTPKRRKNTGAEGSQFLIKKLEIDRDLKEKELQFQREESERKRHDEEMRREKEEMKEERRRRKEEREEERRRREQIDRDRRFELLQEQLLKQNQMLMMILSQQKE